MSTVQIDEEGGQTTNTFTLIYIMIGVIVLLVIAGFVIYFIRKNKEKKLLDDTVNIFRGISYKKAVYD